MGIRLIDWYFILLRYYQEESGRISHLASRWNCRCWIWLAMALVILTFVGKLLKGQSNEIFDPQFFASFEPAWATDQWVKIV